MILGVNQSFYFFCCVFSFSLYFRMNSSCPASSLALSLFAQAKTMHIPRAEQDSPTMSITSTNINMGKFSLMFFFQYINKRIQHAALSQLFFSITNIPEISENIFPEYLFFREKRDSIPEKDKKIPERVVREILKTTISPQNMYVRKPPVSRQA